MFYLRKPGPFFEVLARRYIQANLIKTRTFQRSVQCSSKTHIIIYFLSSFICAFNLVFDNNFAVRHFCTSNIPSFKDISMTNAVILKCTEGVCLRAVSPFRCIFVEFALREERNWPLWIIVNASYAVLVKLHQLENCGLPAIISS